MTTSTRPRPSRPLPVRSPQLAQVTSLVAAAPPVDDTSAPWAALLAELLAAGRFSWVMGPDGALVPVATGSEDAPATPRRGRLVPRLRRSGLGRSGLGRSGLRRSATLSG